MKKVYNYKNATVCVTMPNDTNLDILQEATTKFLRKVLKESIQNGNSNQSRDIRKEQVLYR